MKRAHTISSTASMANAGRIAQRVTGRCRVSLILLLMAWASGCAIRPAPPPSAIPAPAPVAADPAETASLIALSMVGTPYRYGGSNPQGFDCSGLVHYAYHQVGVSVPRTAAEQRRQSTRVAQHQLRPGDLLFFDTTWRAGHVGIYVGGGEFVHAPTSGKRVTRTSLREGYFANRLQHAGRLIEH